MNTNKDAQSVTTDRMAEGVGFEPTGPFRALQFSRLKEGRKFLEFPLGELLENQFTCHSLRFGALSRAWPSYPKDRHSTTQR